MLISDVASPWPRNTTYVHHQVHSASRVAMPAGRADTNLLRSLSERLDWKE